MEPTVHEYIMLHSIPYLVVLFVHIRSSRQWVGKTTKQIFISLVQYGTKGKCISFWCKDFKSFVDCSFMLMPICSIVQSVLSEWEITCGRTVCRSHCSKWYSAGFSVLFLWPLAWLHSKWNMMQLMPIHLKHYETLRNSMMRQMYILGFL